MSLGEETKVESRKLKVKGKHSGGAATYGGFHHRGHGEKAHIKTVGQQTKEP
jgi:hypothetical protein